jgi:hypothetical protein
MRLPESNELPINLLAACFNKTSATYKFYWLLSILQSTENGNIRIRKKDLFARMISNSWFTVNYFKVSFGKQDLIQNTIHTINEIERIKIDERRVIVFDKLSKTKNENTEKLLWHFNNNVPHWFLSPWFPRKESETHSNRANRIYSESQKFLNSCLYSLHPEHIEINPIWVNYLISNSSILKSFCYWHLAIFLQSKNPNVPDIPNKLTKPAIRNGLNKQRTQFWDVVLDEIKSIKCIYTGRELTKGNYAIEHFIPHSFVSHDLMWNLIPADRSFNISKSNKLPIIKKHFEPFYLLQQEAYNIVKIKSPRNKLLEDYLSLINIEDNSLNQDKLRETIQPMVTIASNNGFEFMNDATV